MSAVPHLPLSWIRTGHSAVLTRIQAGNGLAGHLAAMGLVPGVRVHVYRNDRTGPVVLGVHGSRVMFGRGMADKVSVQEDAGEG